MSSPDRKGKSQRAAAAWLVFALAILVLASPLKLAWARPGLGWTFPFCLWLVIIVVGAVAAYRR